MSNVIANPNTSVQSTPEMESPTPEPVKRKPTVNRLQALEDLYRKRNSTPQGDDGASLPFDETFDIHHRKLSTMAACWEEDYDLKADMQALQMVETLDENRSDDLPIEVRQYCFHNVPALRGIRLREDQIRPTAFIYRSIMENKAAVLLASPLGSGKTYVALAALLRPIYHPNSRIAWKNRPVLMITTPISIFRTYAIIRDLVGKESDITISVGSEITMLGGKTIVLQAYGSLSETELSKVSWAQLYWMIAIWHRIRPQAYTRFFGPQRAISFWGLPQHLSLMVQKAP
ncbi:hypothetical protein BDZ91DRAFT_258703 [Kalaharituber pfeilii]|nr:hypothetical protein BDZ91DRAFT_258703 [Kalaharituber pfeilii]